MRSRLDVDAQHGEDTMPTRHQITELQANEALADTDTPAVLPCWRVRLVILRDELRLADAAPVERRQVFGVNPVLEDGLTAYLAHLVAIEEGLADLEARQIARARRRHVPHPARSWWRTPE